MKFEDIKLKELIEEWLGDARRNRRLAEVDRVKQKGQDMEYKCYAHMLEACADELQDLIEEKK